MTGGDATSMPPTSGDQPAATAVGLSRLQLGELVLQALLQPGLHQAAEVVHQLALCSLDGAHPIALTPHQAGPLQLTQLAADVRLGKACGINERSHIHRPLLQLTEQLQAGRLTQQPKELAVLLQQLGRRHGAGGTHEGEYDNKGIMQQPSRWSAAPLLGRKPAGRTASAPH